MTTSGLKRKFHDLIVEKRAASATVSEFVRLVGSPSALRHQLESQFVREAVVAVLNDEQESPPDIEADCCPTVKTLLAKIHEAMGAPSDFDAFVADNHTAIEDYVEQIMPRGSPLHLVYYRHRETMTWHCIIQCSYDGVQDGMGAIRIESMFEYVDVVRQKLRDFENASIPCVILTPPVDWICYYGALVDALNELGFCAQLSQAGLVIIVRLSPGGDGGVTAEKASASEAAQ